MLARLAEHVDNSTNEANATTLAEAAAAALDLYEDNDGTIPDSVFEASFRVTQTHAVFPRNE